jgi:hypothetical protein
VYDGLKGQKQKIVFSRSIQKKYKMEKKRGGDSGLAVDLTETKVTQTAEPAGKDDSLEPKVVKPIVFMSMTEIEAFFRRTPVAMVPTNMYNYDAVLKYLLGAKFAGADLFLGCIYTLHQIERT